MRVGAIRPNLAKLIFDPLVLQVEKRFVHL